MGGAHTGTGRGGEYDSPLPPLLHTRPRREKNETEHSSFISVVPVRPSWHQPISAELVRGIPHSRVVPSPAGPPTFLLSVLILSPQPTKPLKLASRPSSTALPLKDPDDDEPELPELEFGLARVRLAGSLEGLD